MADRSIDSPCLGWTSEKSGPCIALKSANGVRKSREEVQLFFSHIYISNSLKKYWNLFQPPCSLYVGAWRWNLGFIFLYTFMLLNVSWTWLSWLQYQTANVYHLLWWEMVKIEEKYPSFRHNLQFTALLQRRKNSQYSCRRTFGLKKRKTTLWLGKLGIKFLLRAHQKLH